MCHASSLFFHDLLRRAFISPALLYIREDAKKCLASCMSSGCCHLFSWVNLFSEITLSFTGGLGPGGLLLATLPLILAPMLSYLFTPMVIPVTATIAAGRRRRRSISLPGNVQEKQEKTNMTPKILLERLNRTESLLQQSFHRFHGNDRE